MLTLLMQLGLLASAATYNGTVYDTTKLVGVAYAQVTVQADGLSESVTANVFGNYTVELPDAADVTVTARSAGYRTATSGQDRDVVTQPFPAGDSALRVEMSWGDGPLDLDLRGVSQCGEISFSQRMRIHGGVAWRLSNDALKGYGPETIKALPNLPCGDYAIYGRVLGKNRDWSDADATVRVYRGSAPEPVFSTRSVNPNGLRRVWHILDYQVRYLGLDSQGNPVRTYTIVPQLLYLSSIPSRTTVSSCVSTSYQWCATGAIAAGIFPSLLLLAATAAFFIAL